MAPIVRLPSSSSVLGFFSLPRRRFLSRMALRSVPLSSQSVTKSGSDSKVLLKEMAWPELQQWVQSHGFRPGQAMMLWKCLYGNNIWAHSHEELPGLNKEFKKMLSENAAFKALSVKDVLTASDRTRKEVADFVHFGRWVSDRNSCNSLY